MLSQLRRLASRKIRTSTRSRNRRRRLAASFENLEQRRLLAGGGLDPDFGEAGIVTTNIGPVPSSDDFGEAISIQQPDGKILVAGRVNAVDGIFGFAVTRYLDDGSLDPSFGDDGRAYFNDTGVTTVSGIDLQADGKIIIAGYRHLIRLHTNGHLDTNFGENGSLASSVQIRDVEILNNDQIVVGGYKFISSLDREDFAVARFEADGSGLDAAFGTDGLTSVGFGSNHADYGSDLAIGSDGSIYLGGKTNDYSDTSANTYGDFAAIKLDADGALAWSFRHDAGQRLEAVQGLDLDSEDRLVMAGYGYNADSQTMRLTSSGSLDTSFGGGVVTTEFAGSSDRVTSVWVDPHDEVLVAGYSDQSATQYDFAIAKYRADGSLRADFGDNGKVTIDFNGNNDYLRGVALQSDGKIVLAGEAIDPAASPWRSDFSVARLTDSGTLDPTFDGDGKRVDDIQPVREVPSHDFAEAITTQQPDGKILVAGRVSTQYSGIGVAVARYLVDGSLDETFGEDGKVFFNQSGIFLVAAMDLQSDGKMLIAGGNRVVRITDDGELDSGFADNGVLITSNVNDLRVAAGDQFVIAGYQSAGSPNFNDIVVSRYRADGSGLVSTFGTDGHAMIGFGDNHDDIGRGLAISDDGSIYVGGQTYDRTDTAASSYGDFVATKLTATGAPVWSFRHDGGKAGENVQAVALDDQNRLVLAGYGNNGDFNLMRLTGTGELDATFGGGFVTTDFQGGLDQPLSVTVLPNNHVVAAGYAYSSISGNDFAIASYDVNGQLDTGFGVDGKVSIDLQGDNDIAFGIVRQNDGKLVLAGHSRDPQMGAYNYDFGLVRLLVNNPPVASDADVATKENSSVVITSNFSDTNTGDSHTFTVDSTSTLGEVNNSLDGTFTYNPGNLFENLAVGQTAVDRFAYTVTDNEGASSTATVTVTVLGVNDAPVAEVGGAYEVDEGSELTLSSNGSSDIDGVVSAFQWDFDYNGILFTVDATDPNPIFSAASIGGDSVRTVALRVQDNDGAWSIVDATTVRIENVDPSVTHLSVAGDLDEGTEIVVTAAIEDPGYPADTFGLTWLLYDPTGALIAAQGTATPDLTSNFSFTPTDSGVYEVQVTVTDEDGGQSETVTQQIPVSSIAPRIENLTATTPINEGESATLEATIIASEVDQNLTLRVSWKDGPTNEIDLRTTVLTDAEFGADLVNWDPASGQFSISHHFADERPGSASSHNYIVSLAVTDDDGDSFVTARGQIGNVESLDSGATVSRRLDDQSIVGQTFLATGSNLDSIAVDLRHSGGAASVDPSVTLELYEGIGTTGELVAVRGVNDLESGFSGLVAFDFSGVSTSPGDIYSVVAKNDSQQWEMTFETVEGIDDYFDGGALIYGVASPTEDARFLLSYADEGLIESPVITVRNDVPFVTASLERDQINEGEGVHLTGSFQDSGLLDAHRITIYWNPLVSEVSTFQLDATATLSVGRTFASSTDTATLFIDAIDMSTGTVSFSTNHIYSDDVPIDGPGNIFAIGVGVRDDVTQSFGTTLLSVENVAPHVELVSISTGTKKGEPVEVVATASDPGGVNDPLTYTYQVFKGDSDAPFASASGAGLTRFEFVPDEGAAYKIQLSVDDGDSGTSNITQTILIANGLPVANDIHRTTAEDGPALVVEADFVDPDEDDIHTFSVDTTGTIGEVVNFDDGTFAYDPAGRFEELSLGETAVDSFVYSVNDGDGGVSSATVTISIDGANDTGIDIGPGRRLTIRDTLETTPDDLLLSFDDVMERLTISDPNSHFKVDPAVANGNGSGEVVIPYGAFDSILVDTGEGDDQVTFTGHTGGWQGSIEVAADAEIATTNTAFDGSDLSGLMLAAQQINFHGQASVVDYGEAAPGANGNIHLTSSRGIYLSSNASLTTTTGDILLNTNVAGLSEGNFIGIELDGASIETQDGDIWVNSQGGNFNNLNHGLYLHQGARVRALGGGGIHVHSTGGAGTDRNYGVFMRDVGTLIESDRGDIDITALGGQGSDALNMGMFMFTSSQVRAVGSGNINIVASAGSSTSSGLGLSVTASSTGIESNNGDVSIQADGVGQGGVGFSIGADAFLRSVGDGGLTIAASASEPNSFSVTIDADVSTASGNIQIMADSIIVEPDAIVDIAGGAGTFALAPLTANRGMRLGSRNAFGRLSISDAEIDRINTAKFEFGNLDVSFVEVVDSGISTDATVQISTAGQVTSFGGSLSSPLLEIDAGGPVTLNEENVVTTLAVASGGDVSVNTLGDVTIGTGIGANGITAEGSIALSSSRKVRVVAPISTTLGDTISVKTIGDEAIITVTADASIVGPHVELFANKLDLQGIVIADEVDIMTSAAIDLGSSNDVADDTLELSVNEARRIDTETLRVGSLGSGDLSVSSSLSLPNVRTLSLASGGLISQSASVTVQQLALRAIGEVRFNQSNKIETAAVYSQTDTVQINSANGLRFGVVDGLTASEAGSALIAFVTNGDITVATPTSAPARVRLYTFSPGFGVNVESGSEIASDAVDFITDEIRLDGSVFASNVLISTLNSIDVGSSGDTSVGILELDNSEINRIVANRIQLGRSGTPSIHVSQPVNFESIQTVRLRTDGPVNDGDNGAIVAPELAISAGGSVTLDNWELGISVGILAAALTGNDSSLLFENNGALTIGLVDGIDGITTMGGGINVVTHSPLRIDAAIRDSGGGSIELTSTNDGGDDDDDLTINASIQTQGGDGSITLNAGTDLTFGGTQPSRVSVVGAGSITANVARKAKLNLAVPLVTETTTPTISATGLAIIGTENDDNISIDPSDTEDAVQISSSGMSFAKVVLPVNGTIEASGGEGDDSITVSSAVTNSATLSGDEGSDTLQGGGGTNTLAGGDGDDTLVDGGGSNVVVGGGGTNTFVDGGGVNEFESDDSSASDDADAPQLIVQTSVNAVEGSPAAVSIFAALSDPSETLSIRLLSSQSGLALSAGHEAQPGVWTIGSDELDGLTVIAANEGNYTLNVEVTSTESDTGDSATTSGQVQIAVSNAPPLLSVDEVGLGSEDDRAGVGDMVTVSGVLSDLGLADTQTVVIDWGEVNDMTGNADDDRDQLTINAGAGTGFAFDHQYATGGLFTVTVTATDGAGETAQQSLDVWVSGVRLDPNTDQLQIIGTAGNDYGTVARIGSTLVVASDLIPGRFWWLPLGTENFKSVDVESILIDLGGGNDVFTILGRADQPATLIGGDGNDVLTAGDGATTLIGGPGNDWLFGGDADDFVDGGDDDDRVFGGDGNDLLLGGGGDDRIEGGRGEDLVVGGDGNDRVDGGRGMDLVFGGLGADDLRGGQDSDLLVAGRFDLEDDLEALLLIRDAWTAGATYDDRISKIRTGLTAADGSTVRLDQDGDDPTVTADGDRDRLLGQGGVDWFFAEIGSDKVLGKRRAEQIG